MCHASHSSALSVNIYLFMSWHQNEVFHEHLFFACLRLVPGVSPLSFSIFPSNIWLWFLFLAGFCLFLLLGAEDWSCRGLHMLSMHFTTTRLLQLWVVICPIKLTWLHEEKDVHFCFLQRGKGVVLWTHLESWSFLFDMGFRNFGLACYCGTWSWTSDPLASASLRCWDY